MVVPTVSPDTFRQQVAALGEIGRIVPLQELLEIGSRDGKPRFALTFDDDYVSHVDSVLPILDELGLPATFFLCGRALHGAGPFWFESLERLIASRGLRRVAALLGAPSADAEALALACEEDTGLQRIVEREAPNGISCLEAEDIATLARAGMTIGFHTLDHQVLPKLSDADVEHALVRGRHALEAIVERPLAFFAYPHGRADQRTAAKVRESGYVAAWTGTPRPGRRGDDPYLLGRWEAGPLMTDEFLVSVSIRLNREGTGR
jgi:peptidoglycan/xylan/chitin deacetylase (PgdA/CDA1 family)